MGEVYHKGHCDLSNLGTANMRIGENDIVGVNGTDSTMSFVNTAEEVPHSNKEVPLDHLETTAKGTVRDAFAVSMFEKGNMNLELSVLPNISLDSTSVAPLNPGAPSSVSAKMTHSPYKPLKLAQALPSGGSNVPVSPNGPLKSGKTSLKGTGMNPFSKCYVPQSLSTVPQPSQQLYGLLSTVINSAEVDARAMNTPNIGHNPSFHSNTLTHNGTVAAEPILPQSAQRHYRSQRHTVGSVSQARSRGPPLMPHHLYTTKKVYPCVDFQHGKCCRGNDCRFAHVSLEDINAEIARLDADKEAYSNKCIGPSQSCTPQRSYEIPVVGRGQGEINLSEISIPNICLNVQTNQSTSVSCGGYSTNHIMDNQLVPSSSNKHYNQPYTYNESLSSNYSAEFSKLGNLSHHHHHNWLMNPSDTLIPVHPPWGLFSPQLQTNTNQPINTVSVLQQQYTAPVFPGLYDTGSMPIIPARSMTISEDLVCGALTGSNSSNPNHIFSNTQGELPYMLHSSLMNSGKKIPYHHDPYNRFSSSLVNSDVSNPISNPPESSSSVYMYPHSMTSEDTHSIQVLFKSDSYPVPMGRECLTCQFCSGD